MTDQTWHKADLTLYTEGNRVDPEQIPWASPFPSGTSAHKTELIALTDELKLGKNKVVNIYTN